MGKYRQGISLQDMNMQGMEEALFGELEVKVNMEEEVLLQVAQELDMVVAAVVDIRTKILHLKQEERVQLVS